MMEITKGFTIHLNDDLIVVFQEMTGDLQSKETYS